MPRPTCLALTFALTTGCTLGSGKAVTEGRPLTDFEAIHSHDVVDIEVNPNLRTDGIDLTCDDNLIDLIRTDLDNGVLTVRFKKGVMANPQARCVLETGNTSLVELVSTGSGDVNARGPLWALDTIRTTGSGDLDVSIFDVEGDNEDVDDGDLNQGDGGDLTDSGAGDLTETDEGDLNQGDDQGDSHKLAQIPPTDDIYVLTTGSGDVSVKGLDLKRVELRTTGSGDVSLSGDANRIDATSTGSGDVRARNLHANKADVTTTGSGDMTAYATERADARSTGSGDITIYGNPDQRSKKSTGSGDIRFR